MQSFHDRNHRYSQSGLFLHVFLYLVHGPHILLRAVRKGFNAAPRVTTRRGRQFLHIHFPFRIEVLEMQMSHLRHLFRQCHPSQQVRSPLLRRQRLVFVWREGSVEDGIGKMKDIFVVLFHRIGLPVVDPAFLNGEIIRLRDIFSGQFLFQPAVERFPAGQIIVPQKSAPFLVRVIADSGSSDFRSPIRDEHTGILFRQCPVGCGRAIMLGLVQPTSDQPVRLRPGQTVLKFQ